MNNNFSLEPVGFIWCFQVTFVQKYFPPLSDENVKQWQKMVMYKLYLCLFYADKLLLYISSFDHYRVDGLSNILTRAGLTYVEEFAFRLRRQYFCHLRARVLAQCIFRRGPF